MPALTAFLQVHVCDIVTSLRARHCAAAVVNVTISVKAVNADVYPATTVNSYSWFPPCVALCVNVIVSCQVEQSVTQFPRPGYQLPDVAGAENFTAGAYSSGVMVSLPVGEPEARAIMDRFPYLYNSSLLPSSCNDRWFEVGSLWFSSCDDRWFEVGSLWSSSCNSRWFKVSSL